MSKDTAGDHPEQVPLSPAEFTRRMPDEEEGAGPGAPETDNPERATPGDGSTDPDRPAWPAGEGERPSASRR